MTNAIDMGGRRPATRDPRAATSSYYREHLSCRRALAALPVASVRREDDNRTDCDCCVVWCGVVRGEIGIRSIYSHFGIFRRISRMRKECRSRRCIRNRVIGTECEARCEEESRKLAPHLLTLPIHPLTTHPPTHRRQHAIA